MANLLRRVRLTAAALLLCTGLCGCIVDGGTGEVKGPVYVTSMLAAGAALSRPAAKAPTEWKTICATSFDLRWSAPKPKADGIVAGGALGVSLALRRAGATYAAGDVDERLASQIPTLFPSAGLYRVRRTDATPRCDALLDQVIRKGSSAESALPAAVSCLSAERIGPYGRPGSAEASFAAPYNLKGISEERELGGGAFNLKLYGESLVDQRTGKELARQMLTAYLSWREPDQNHLYWGSTRDCGPRGFHRSDPGLLGRRLFAEGDR